MPRIKIDLPEKFPFSTTIPIRITDINYGGHVGNDTILSIIHEARIQFLDHFGYTELNCGGTGLIMSDAGIEFKTELFYGNHLLVSVAAAGFSKVAFEIFYKIEKQDENQKILVALGKTGMVCYDYQNKKIAAVPAAVKEKLSS